MSASETPMEGITPSSSSSSSSFPPSGADAPTPTSPMAAGVATTDVAPPATGTSGSPATLKRQATSPPIDSIRELIAKAKASRGSGWSGDAATSADVSKEEEGTTEQKGVIIDTSLENELTCSICTELIYRPVAVLDCLHTFCGSCVKPWLSRSEHCPSCRARVRMVRDDYRMGSLLEMFLRLHPEKARGEEERVELDKVYKAGEKIVVPDSERESGIEDDEEDYDDVEDVEDELTYGWRPCPCCYPPDPNPYGYTCPTPIPHPEFGEPYHSTGRDQCNDHVLCPVCRGSVPMSSLQPELLCAGCERLCCGAVWEKECKLVEVGEVELDTNMADNGLFEHNTVEKGLWLRWKAESNISDADCAAQVKTHVLLRNNNHLNFTYYRHFIPSDPGAPRSLPPTALICKHCSRDAYKQNFVSWWITKKAELGEGFDGRPKCWYGRECRTQRHAHHAERMNHMCEVIPERERRNTAPRGGRSSSGDGNGVDGGGGAV